MYVDLVRYPHFFTIVVIGLSVISHYVHCFSAIPSSFVPNLAPQKVPPPIQDKHGDVMEDSEWAH